MDAGGWVRAARSRDVGGSQFTSGRGPDGPVLLARLASGQVIAFETACPHTFQPLTRGEITADGCIECPIHFYRYDTSTGQNVFPAIDGTDAPLRLYAVRETDDGWVEVSTPG